jgi:hypothetical protein
MSSGETIPWHLDWRWSGKSGGIRRAAPIVSDDEGGAVQKKQIDIMQPRKLEDLSCRFLQCVNRSGVSTKKLTW